MIIKNYLRAMRVLHNVRGYLITSDHQLYHLTPLKTPFGLLIPLLQSQSHATTITIIFYAVTRLHNYNPYTFITKITYSTLARLHSLQTLHSNLYCTIAHKVSWLTTSSLADFSAIGHFHRLSHTVAHAKSSIHTANRLRYLLRELTS
jgi:hypothetical protein